MRGGMDLTVVASGLGLAVAVIALVYARSSALAVRRKASMASEARHEHSRPNVVIDEVGWALMCAWW